MYKDLDLKILTELERDGRASLRQIALALGVATTTVSNRIKALEREGVIRGYRPVIDYPKLGFHLTAVIQIKAHGEGIPQVVKELEGHDQLTHVYETTGDFDILVIGKFRDTEGMNREIKRLLSNPMIEGTNTSVVLAAAKENGTVRLLESD